MIVPASKFGRQKGAKFSNFVILMLAEIVKFNTFEIILVENWLKETFWGKVFYQLTIQSVIETHALTPLSFRST